MTYTMVPVSTAFTACNLVLLVFIVLPSECNGSKASTEGAIMIEKQDVHLQITFLTVKTLNPQKCFM